MEALRHVAIATAAAGAGHCLAAGWPRDKAAEAAAAGPQAAERAAGAARRGRRPFLRGKALWARGETALSAAGVGAPYRLDVFSWGGHAYYRAEELPVHTPGLAVRGGRSGL